jgi:gliding motility-associated lipoprotein GldH
LKKIIAVIIFCIALQACHTIGVFEKTEAFAGHAWPAADTLHFTFNIEDTAANYNVYVVLRHTDAYKYNNIWLNITSTSPGDTAVSRQQAFVLANNNGWLGTAMDDVIEQRMSITGSAVRFKKGSYTVALRQIMRDDPLQHILNAGVRVEKAVQ